MENTVVKLNKKGKETFNRVNYDVIVSWKKVGVGVYEVIIEKVLHHLKNSED